MLKSVGQAIASVVPSLLLDAAGLAAVGAIAYGAWLIYEPAGFITAGVLILAGVIAVSTARK